MEKEQSKVEPAKTYKTYRIAYQDGRFLTYWNGLNAAHARALCAEYYHISTKRLTATRER